MTTPTLPRGPVMADVAGLVLTAEERQRLYHPAVGGVILFRRNYASREQLTALVAQIKALRQPELVVAVDHEGGRVQRFIDGFTRLPAMRALGEVWDAHGQAAAQAQAEQVGWVLAAELRACGVDLSFTPVLDLDWGCCAVIGNRSFHGDSHHTLPEDRRSLDELWEDDLLPFEHLSEAGMAAVMPAHVVYPQVDSEPAGFSAVWLQQVLREELGFNGVIFSDDLTMEGASMAGDIRARAARAFAAGCDIVLVCNKPAWVDALLQDFAAPPNPQLAARWQFMAGSGEPSEFAALLQTPEFQAAQAQVAALASHADVAGGVKVGEAF